MDTPEVIFHIKTTPQRLRHPITDAGSKVLVFRAKKTAQKAVQRGIL
ncbi:hypothetical protein T296_13475 [Pantoea agglomerans Eh318]|nr:hypothetical protein T296_13475 [Pantoea agglomerans Eh318]